MVDRDLNIKINRLKEFMQLWVKFHDMFKTALSRDTISPEEENTFLETKSLIARKYQALKEFLGIAPSYEDKTFDVISQVLSLKSVATISDLSLHKIENDWHNSYILLNKMLGELEGRQESFRRIGRLKLFIEGLFSNPIINLILAIIMIAGIYFFLNYCQENKIIEFPKIKAEKSENTTSAPPAEEEAKGKIEFLKE